MSFNGQRLTIARQRRGHSKTSLASLLDVTARSVSGWESGEYPPESGHIAKLVDVLAFPESFFEAGDLVAPNKDAVSFRSMTSMKAAQRDATIAACAVANMLTDWVETKYTLPPVDVPDMREYAPEVAAEALRQHWRLGYRPIGHMVHLLEAKGVRVFSLSQNCVEVDACSIWLAGRPFALLNTYKSAERSRFDAAHELGHLLLHKHGAPNGQEAEKEANTFARHFLMPVAAVRADAPRVPTLGELLRKKKTWNVSVAALAYHYWKIGVLSEWHYKSLAIEMQGRGWRTNEPEGSERERSRLWEKLFAALRQEGKGKGWLAHELSLPTSEISELLFGLVTSSVEGIESARTPPRRGHLKLVSDG